MFDTILGNFYLTHGKTLDTFSFSYSNYFKENRLTALNPKFKFTFMKNSNTPKSKPAVSEDMESVLDIAVRVTSGDRRRDYDSATPNHERIAGAWNWYLGARKDPSAPISGLDVASMMILLKIARAVYTPTKDSYVDIAGYAKCCSQIAGFETQ